MTAQMLWNEKQLVVLDESDVIVCGGGPAGISAAVACSQAGLNVTLVEQIGCLGGMGTAGLVPAFIHMTDGENILAAGIAAALTIKQKADDVRSINIGLLRKSLRDQGAYLPNV